MDKQEILNKIKQIMITEEYDIETILETVPAEFLEDVKQLWLENAKRESEEIYRSKSNRSK